MIPHIEETNIATPLVTLKTIALSFFLSYNYSLFQKHNYQNLPIREGNLEVSASLTIKVIYT